MDCATSSITRTPFLGSPHIRRVGNYFGGPVIIYVGLVIDWGAGIRLPTSYVVVLYEKTIGPGLPGNRKKGRVNTSNYL